MTIMQGSHEKVCRLRYDKVEGSWQALADSGTAMASNPTNRQGDMVFIKFTVFHSVYPHDT